MNSTTTQKTQADLPKHSRADVIRLTGLSDGQLKGILDRQVVTLATHNPGSGNARLFSDSDAIKLAVAREMARIGIPMRFLARFADRIDERAREWFYVADVVGHPAWADFDKKAAKVGFHRGLWWMLFPVDDGEWGLAEFHRSRIFRADDWPVAYSVIQVDQMLWSIFMRLMAHKGAETPERAAQQESRHAET